MLSIRYRMYKNYAIFYFFCKNIVNNTYNTLIYYIIRMYNYSDVRGDVNDNYFKLLKELF